MKTLKDTLTTALINEDCSPTDRQYIKKSLDTSEKEYANSMKSGIWAYDLQEHVEKYYKKIPESRAVRTPNIIAFNDYRGSLEAYFLTEDFSKLAGLILRGNRFSTGAMYNRDRKDLLKQLKGDIYEIPDKDWGLLKEAFLQFIPELTDKKFT